MHRAFATLHHQSLIFEAKIFETDVSSIVLFIQQNFIDAKFVSVIILAQCIFNASKLTQIYILFALFTRVVIYQ